MGARNTSRQSVSPRLMLTGLMLRADLAEDLAASYGDSFASKAQNYNHVPVVALHSRSHNCNN